MVEEAFNAGRLDPSLPYLKREAMRLLTAEYTTEQEALTAIGQGLPKFYAKEYPALAGAKSGAIRDAAETLQQVYAVNFFPEMKVSWRAYPNHLGHLASDGCFRCHDGLHRSAGGKVVTKDCNACHTIMAQGPPEALAGVPLHEQPFQHPVDVGMDVSELKCSECHTGTDGL